MIARVTTGQADRERLDEAIRRTREQTLTTVQAQPGFRSYQLLVDRAAGTFLSLSVWESVQALQQAETVLNRERTQATQAHSGQGVTSTMYEVAVQG